MEKDLLELEVDYEIIFLEENQRNTAMPSILAALYIELIYGDALMLIAPSDHYISPNFAMNSVIEQAISFTEDRIVIFGIKPNSPSTEYGYIRVGNIIKHDIAYEVKSFKEKPDIESKSQISSLKARYRVCNIIYSVRGVFLEFWIFFS
ncbi:sugar phosphate nucleotidyltransferase [Candidatus Lariskella endosymbiont of Hedychridium roseum]|uniref:sugar phosphate nucleotidyltransferase n=1 Tax=Candidatus Lariskella endosymbiont of Hedychridium roseum TaxID=3077949 RepID=UPI0030CEBA60